MINVEDIKKIIETNGGSASLSEISSMYGKNHHMMMFAEHRNVIFQILKKDKSFRKIRSTDRWELKSTNVEYLYVSDNKIFQTHQEVFKYICDDGRNLRQKCYFNNRMNNIDVWFPKEQNKKWVNTLSEDGRYFTYAAANGDPISLNDNPRYIFFYEKENNGYRFVGLFKPYSNDGVTARYELVDDKVMITKRDKPLIICAISYMNYYNGTTDNDILIPRGSYGALTGDGHEKKNFKLQNDGLYHGFVETKETKKGSGKYNTIALEQFDFNCTKDDAKTDGVTVVFVAKPENESNLVVVGWYKNATVYRERIVDGNDITMMTCLPNDAYLIDKDNRTFKIPDGHNNSFGIGTSNFYYIQSIIQNNSEANDLYHDLLDYIDNNHHKALTFNDYLTIKVNNNLLTENSKTQYINSLNQLSNELQGSEIDCPLLNITEIDKLENIKIILHDKNNELGQKNATRKNTWSAALAAYIDYLKS